MKKEFVAVGNIYHSDIPRHCFAYLKLNLGRKSEFLGEHYPGRLFYGARRKTLWDVGIQSPTVSAIIPPTCRS